MKGPLERDPGSGLIWLACLVVMVAVVCIAVAS